MSEPKQINQLTEAEDLQDTDVFPMDRTVSEGVFSTLKMKWLTIKTWILAQLAGKADTSHTQGISTITGLVDALAGKSSTSHNHDSVYYTKTAIDTLLALLAALNSPSFTGSPTAPTASAGTNSTLIATTAFVKTALDALIAGAPGALDTLKEISDQLANDENAVAALTTVVSSKVPSTRTVAGKALSADVTLVKADVGLPNVDNTSDANKPISSATQTALNGKQASMTAASQAEMEAGTEAALRSMSPLRVKQAILALGGGGGGGGSTVSGKATLTGYAISGSSATRAVGSIYCWEWSYGTGTITINISGSDYVFTIDSSDPSNGSFWVDSTILFDPYMMANALQASIAANLSGLLQNIVVNGDATTVTFEHVNEGSGATLSLSKTIGSIGVGATSGSDAVAPSGGTQFADIIAADGTKVLTPLRIWVYSEDQTGAYFNGCRIGFQLRVGGSSYALGSISGVNSNGAELAPFNTAYNTAQEWFAGRAGAKLVAYISADEGYTIPVGGQVTIYAKAEQP